MAETVIEDPTDIDRMMEENSRKDLEQSFKIFHDKLAAAKAEIEKVIKGQDELVYSVLRALAVRGHVLLEGLPGLGKTVLCRCLSRICKLEFKRVQFTTDLLPSDIIGIMTYDKERGFDVVKGPIFTNIMLADEINRAPPKVQSALLEAMGERQVTLGKTTHELRNPFLVLATQNPIEQAGTYPLPEAQLDRFLFKVIVTYPDYDSEYHIMQNNLNNMHLDQFKLKVVLTKEDIIAMQGLINLVHVDLRLKEYILNIVRATRNPYEVDLEHAALVNIGASPRASINILLAARAQCLIRGRYYLVPQDVKDVLHEVLRHRIHLNFQAKMANVDTDKIIDEILEKIQIY
jgi:MoxR-like ATPase